MGAAHPGHGNVVEPVSSNGTPDAVQFFALSLIMTLRNISPTPSPSLWLRAPSPQTRRPHELLLEPSNGPLHLISAIKNHQFAIHSGADDQFAIPTAAPPICQTNDVTDLNSFCLFTPEH